MVRTWRVPKAFVVVLLLGLVAWLVPTSSSGARFDCGPAITAAFGFTRPADPDRFIPTVPGGDAGTVASQSCKLRSILPGSLGGIAVLVGTVGVAAAWTDRNKRSMPTPPHELVA